ncbi:winged helix-turn-helix domain-containing protein [Sphingomonas sp. LT1P40]|uniref:winged helix-turn-helix domain-containing protein n=1 Tax=Alteristakelama amylovorans TaxID=3096166 RepID=UPI002FCB6323
MGQKIISEIDIPLFDKAIAARGYALVLGAPPFAHDRDVAAILRRWEPGRRIDRSRVPEIAVAHCAASLAAALDAGAADAVVHPVDPFELAARVDVRIRTHVPGEMRIGDLSIDPIHRRVMRANQPIALVAREYAVLLYLAERQGEYVTRRELLECVWKLRFDPGTNVVAVHVSKLRAKLERTFDGPMIRSAKGLGYRLDAG